MNLVFMPSYQIIENFLGFDVFCSWGENEDRKFIAFSLCIINLHMQLKIACFKS